MIYTTNEMSTKPRWRQFKEEGDSYHENGKFLKAIGSYDQALKFARTSIDATNLLLARSTARLPFHAYDAALADAKAALTFPPADKPPSYEHETALLLAAKAEYGLRRFRESYRWIKNLITYYPTNDEGLDMVKLCIWRIVEQEQGIYQWAGMLEEARRGETNSDHADYVGPIEVRVCEDPRCGRGLFATKDVEPGELLLVEKAFSAAFAKRGECSEEVWKPDRPAGDGARPKPDEIEEKAREEIVALCAELGTLTFVKIARNRSLEPAFLDLYPGANTDEEVDKRKNSIFTKGAIQNRLAYNAFAFPLISLPASNVTKPVSTVTPSRGVWLQASYINHTCNPNIHRSFISDLIILRAQAHIPRDTELRLGYTSCFEPVSQRRAFLSHYGFNCECERCITEAGTPQADLETRDKISMEIERLMEGNDGMGVGVYMKMLEVFDATYKTTQSVEPRLAFVSPLLNILAAAKAEDMHVHVISLVCRLLRSLGFVVRVSLHGGEKRFEILKWGFLIDEIVIAMTDLVQAFEALGQEGWRRGAEREAKKCYLIMCGEDSSWNEVYTEGGDGVEKEGVGRC